MVAYNVTVDAFSPIIHYSPEGAWIEGDQADNFVSQYDLGTFKLTTTIGATATIEFVGTTIRIVGAKRPNHAEYGVTLDGVDQPGVFSGFASPNQFQQPLFFKTGLPPGKHTLVLTNKSTKPDAPYLDVDYVYWENTLNSVAANATLSTQIIDDADISWTYDGGWRTSSQNTTEYLRQTIHFTPTIGDSATLKFTGETVAVYGGVLPDHGNYSVSLNGSYYGTFSGRSNNFHPQQLLFYADGLGFGEHKLLLTNKGIGWFDIDYAIVQSWNNGGNSTTIGGSSTDASSRTKSPNRGVIVGSVVGSVVLLALVALVWFYFMARWKRRQEEKLKDAISEQMQGFIVAPFVVPNGTQNEIGIASYPLESTYGSPPSYQHVSGSSLPTKLTSRDMSNQYQPNTRSSLEISSSAEAPARRRREK